MDIEAIRDWLRREPLAADTALAVGLGLLTAAQIWSFTQFAPHFPGRGFMMAMRGPDTGLAYVLAFAAFLPLALRRQLPWFALGASGFLALAYEMLRLPPVFVLLAPMIALYTLAADAPRRNVAVIVLAVAAVAVAAAALAFTQVRWLVDSVRTFVLLGSAAFLGESTRSQRQYTAEVEQRAAEAERTREEEALRRVDEERLRIAREVHDVVAHSLAIVTVQAAAAGELVDSDPARAHESIEHIRTTGKQALAELRSMLGVLRTGETESPRQPAADLASLPSLVAQVREAGVETELSVTGDLREVPAAASVSAFRIVQEALTNVARHSGAGAADVRLAVTPERLEIEVLDSGAGARAGELTGGHGIRGMAERAEALGGTLSAGPRTDARGFRVRAVLPLRKGA